VAAPYAQSFSTSSPDNANKNVKLLIVGGGTGGSAIANKFARKLGAGQVAVLEPNEKHYNQALFTLVGAGIKSFAQAEGDTGTILGSKVQWIRDRAVEFQPAQSTVTTEKGDQIKYDFMLVAMGVQLHYDRVKGLVEALEHDPMVVSNYSPKYVRKTFAAAQRFKKGNAVFTLPSTPIKCAGAPQKICYLLEDYFTKEGKRGDAKFIYSTALPVVYQVQRYAKALMEEVVGPRNINLELSSNLIEVDHVKKIAKFEGINDRAGEKFEYPYELLHATPPQSAPTVLKSSALVDATDFVEVNKHSLQHKRFPNVFAIGDCTNTPTSKTAASVASQCGVVEANLHRVMKGKVPNKMYNGYTSCPILTSSKTCVMAEFGYDQVILETFPINQNRNLRSMYLMKAEIIPRIYWHGLVKGHWNGPGLFRNLMRFGIV
jgi:sulfide:quinone oxidoreductase